jgi:hypothetical protein
MSSNLCSMVFHEKTKHQIVAAHHTPTVSSYTLANIVHALATKRCITGHRRDTGSFRGLGCNWQPSCIRYLGRSVTNIWNYQQLPTTELHNGLFGSCRLDARSLTDGQSDRLDEGTALQTFVTNAHKKEKKDVNNAVSVRYRRDWKYLFLYKIKCICPQACMIQVLVWDSRQLKFCIHDKRRLLPHEWQSSAVYICTAEADELQISQTPVNCPHFPARVTRDKHDRLNSLPQWPVRVRRVPSVCECDGPAVEIKL